MKTRKFLSRDEYIVHGAVLLERSLKLGTKEAQEAYAAWHDRAKLTQIEKLTVARLAYRKSRA